MNDTVFSLRSVVELPSDDFPWALDDDGKRKSIWLGGGLPFPFAYTSPTLTDKRDYFRASPVWYNPDGTVRGLQIFLSNEKGQYASALVDGWTDDVMENSWRLGAKMTNRYVVWADGDWGDKTLWTANQINGIWTFRNVAYPKDFKVSRYPYDGWPAAMLAYRRTTDDSDLKFEMVN